MPNKQLQKVREEMQKEIKLKEKINSDPRDELFLVVETGPNGDYTTHVFNIEDADYLVDTKRDWWKPFVEHNKAPERTFQIIKYVRANE
jgi:hypothetical protein